MTQADRWRQNSNEIYKLAESAFNEIRKDYNDAKIVINIRSDGEHLLMDGTLISENLIASGFIADEFFKIKKTS